MQRAGRLRHLTPTRVSARKAHAGMLQVFLCEQSLTEHSAEMDVWEANSVSTALTPHSCQPEGYSVCEDDTCGGTYSLDRYAGTCDANGCDCK